MIPHVFHRIYLDEPVPEKFEAYWERFRELHPGWSFMTWDDSTKLDWMVNREAFERATTHAGRSDVLRYEILHHVGGIYVDTDVEPLRAFDGLVEEDTPFAGWENDKLICPTVMGGPKGHPALQALISSLDVWTKRHTGRPPNVQTGPWYLTRMWATRSDVRLLPPAAFYPVGWWERDKLGGPYPAESFCVHHWMQGWDPEAKARIDARQT